MRYFACCGKIESLLLEEDFDCQNDLLIFGSGLYEKAFHKMLAYWRETSRQLNCKDKWYKRFGHAEAAEEA